MRRVILATLLAVLAGLLAARSAAARPAQTAAMTVRWYPEAYNVLELDAPAPAGTAGSSRFTELDGYFFSRTPTAKSGYTGRLAGRDLIVLLAEDWTPDAASLVQTPALWRLLSEGVRFSDAYAPDWYQGADGRQFALLTGLTPTAVGEDTAMAWAGQQGTYLPFALGVCLGQAGYDCRVYPAGEGREASYRALGFTPCPRPDADADALAQALPSLGGSGPCAALFVLTGRDAEQTMDRLWRTLDETGRTADTLLCLLAGSAVPGRSTLVLWSADLPAQELSVPCSELDVTPTLLDLLGAPYDARFLCGRDLLSPDAGGVPVSLAGSAWADWVTQAGYYDAARDRFTPAAGQSAGGQETARYVLQMRQAVYEQYVYARQVMECNYFQMRIGGQK